MKILRNAKYYKLFYKRLPVQELSYEHYLETERVMKSIISQLKKRENEELNFNEDKKLSIIENKMINHFYFNLKYIKPNSNLRKDQIQQEEDTCKYRFYLRFYNFIDYCQDNKISSHILNHIFITLLDMLIHKYKYFGTRKFKFCFRVKNLLYFLYLENLSLTHHLHFNKEINILIDDDNNEVSKVYNNSLFDIKLFIWKEIVKYYDRLNIIDLISLLNYLSHDYNETTKLLKEFKLEVKSFKISIISKCIKILTQNKKLFNCNNAKDFFKQSKKIEVFTMLNFINIILGKNQIKYNYSSITLIDILKELELLDIRAQEYLSHNISTEDLKSTYNTFYQKKEYLVSKISNSLIARLNANDIYNERYTLYNIKFVRILNKNKQYIKRKEVIFSLVVNFLKHNADISKVLNDFSDLMFDNINIVDTYIINYYLYRINNSSIVYKYGYHGIMNIIKILDIFYEFIQNKLDESKNYLGDFKSIETFIKEKAEYYGIIKPYFNNIDVMMNIYAKQRSKRINREYIIFCLYKKTYSYRKKLVKNKNNLSDKKKLNAYKEMNYIEKTDLLRNYLIVVMNKEI